MGTPSEPDHEAMLVGMEDLLAAMKHRTPADAVDGSVVNESVSEAESPSSLESNDPLVAAPWGALRLDGVADVVERDRVFHAMFQVPAQEQKLGRYVVLGTLGHGGMGIVLEAFDRTLDRRVALKVLHKELDDKQTKRLLREAQAMAKLSHPNVVQVYEAGDVDGQAFVAMELVQGQMLGGWMRQVPRPEWRACVKTFIRLGAGRERAGRRVVPLAASEDRGGPARPGYPADPRRDRDGHTRLYATRADDRAGRRCAKRPVQLLRVALRNTPPRIPTTRHHAAFG